VRGRAERTIGRGNTMEQRPMRRIRQTTRRVYREALRAEALERSEPGLWLLLLRLQSGCRRSVSRAAASRRRRSHGWAYGWWCTFRRRPPWVPNICCDGHGICWLRHRGEVPGRLFPDFIGRRPAACPDYLSRKFGASDATALKLNGC